MVSLNDMNCVGYTTIALFLSFTIIIPICIWSTRRIYRSIKLSDAFMMARKPNLSFNLICLNLFDVAIIQPLYCVLYITLDLKPFTHTTIIASLTDIRFIVFGFFFVSRMWILHFDHLYHRECVNMLWYRDNNESFYLKYRSTFGNVSFVIKFTVLFCVLCLLLLVSEHSIYFIDILDTKTILFISNLTRLILFTIEGMLLWIFYCKINGIDDKFGIKKEILYISLWPGSCALIYYLAFEISISEYITFSHYFSECTEFYIYSFAMLFIISATLVIKTFIPIRFRTNEEHAHTIRLMAVGAKSSLVHFEDVLGSRSALLLFVEHLESEFSVENILFLVEVAKFREHYLSQILHKAQYQLLLQSGINLTNLNAEKHKKQSLLKKKPPLKVSQSVDSSLQVHNVPTDSATDHSPSASRSKLQLKFVHISAHSPGVDERETPSHTPTGKLKHKLTFSRLLSGGKSLDLYDNASEDISPKPKKYSLMIDFEIVQDVIVDDFDLGINIQNFVHPLLANFIPVPTEYHNCTARQAARNIFEQFVDNGSTHMINISWQCRTKIAQLIDKPFKDEDLSIIFLFDHAFSEIYSCIVSDSFLRFRMSEKFKNFLKSGHLRDSDATHSQQNTMTSTGFGQSYSEIHEQLKNFERPKTNKLGLELTTIQSGRTTDMPQFDVQDTEIQFSS